MAESAEVGDAKYTQVAHPQSPAATAASEDGMQNNTTIELKEHPSGKSEKTRKTNTTRAEVAGIDPHAGFAGSCIGGLPRFNVDVQRFQLAT